MKDIVIPKNNEDGLILMAEKLGYKELLLLYPFEEYAEKAQNSRRPDKADSKIKLAYGILANERSIQKISSKFQNKNVFVAIKSPINAREIIERSQADLIFSLESLGRKDFMHQRGSGLDHIMAKLAHDKNIAIGFSLSSIMDSKDKGIIMGRVMQNITLCRKYKVKTMIASFASSPFGMRSPYDMTSLFTILGMAQEEAKGSLSSI